MALASLVQSAKNHSSLKYVIQQALRRDEAKSFADEEKWIRGSSVSSICPREEVICALLEIMRPNTVDSDLMMIFLHGTALHWVLQNEILAGTGVLLGQWRCNWCMKKHGGRPKNGQLELGLVSRPKVCKRCQKSDFTYNELFFHDEDIRVNGHPDGFLRLAGRPGIGILEAKSIGEKGGWAIKKTPNIGHVVQLQVYLMLTGLKWGVILYWIKGANGMAALVEHFVERDDEVIAEVRSMIMSIWRGIRTRILPDRICENDSCERAQGCMAAGPCFQLGDIFPARKENDTAGTETNSSDRPSVLETAAGIDVGFGL